MYWLCTLGPIENGRYTRQKYHGVTDEADAVALFQEFQSNPDVHRIIVGWDRTQ